MKLEFPPRRTNYIKSINDYIKIKEIGAGAYSKVYLVEDANTKEKYALKTMELNELSQDDFENVVKEIESHINFNHPNIIKLYDYIKIGSKVYMLLEYIDSGNVFYYLTKNHPLQEKTIAKFFHECVSAIKHIHSKSYIHRDIKPENLLIDKNKNLRICDFGWCSSIQDTAYR